MKNRNCPNIDACWDYDASNCEGCAIGQKIEKFARKIKRLQAENAELRARLENAVELPCKVGDTVYCIRDLGFGRYRIEEQTASGIVFDYNNRMHVITPYGLFGYENWTFNVDCFTDRVAAEARLAELKGGRE